MASAGRRFIYWSLSLLGLVLVGVLAVLTTVQIYFGVDERDQITIQEAQYWESAVTLPYGTNATELVRLGAAASVEKITRILHQTWKSDVLPERWQSVHDQCIEMNPDFEYMLWTDDSARVFIQQHYPWFIDIYDNYPYPIQRADAIRYFVLHHYGGVYMDLDIGCKRPLLPLLNFEVILPRTIPVGVSNDLMFSSPRHPFMDLVTHNLVIFNHQYGTNYPTVMFSTGPMFLSAQYGLWPSSTRGDRTGVRILPKSLYGKNAKPEESEHSFFYHYYGSSWHADDASFVTFLGKFGMAMMYGGAVVLTLGCLRLVYIRRFAAPTPAGPITLPFSAMPDTSSLLPISSETSRPGSPAPFGKRGTAAGAPFAKDGLYWVPFYSTRDGASPYDQADSKQGWTSYLPAFLAYDSSQGGYHPVPSFPSRPLTPNPEQSGRDTDNYSVHSLQSIKTTLGKKQHSRYFSQSDVMSSSEEDLESGTDSLPGYEGKQSVKRASRPQRHARKRNASNADQTEPALPAYSRWASWLFRPAGSSGNANSTQASNTLGSSSGSNLTPLQRHRAPREQRHHREQREQHPFRHSRSTSAYEQSASTRHADHSAPGGSQDGLSGQLLTPGNALSRQASTSSVLTSPPGYESSEETVNQRTEKQVDQLLSEMEDPFLSPNPSDADSEKH